MDLEEKNYTERLNIQVSGTVPTGGNLVYENNVLQNGCLTIDEYKVTIENGKVTTMEKGSCENISLTACDSPNFNPSPIEWFSFNDTNNPGKVTGFSDAWDGTTDITIPCYKSDGTKIVEMGYDGLQNKGLQSVTISDTVKSLKVSLSSNPIKKLVLGNGLEEISSGSIYHVELENSTLVLPNSLKIITDGAFTVGCNIEKIVFGTGLEELSGGAFGNNPMRKVILPEGIKKFGMNPFRGESLEEITFSKNTGEITIFGGSDAYPNLKIIHNNTGKEYDWNLIINDVSGTPFETGTVTREDGSIVNIVKD